MNYLSRIFVYGICLIFIVGCASNQYVNTNYIKDKKESPKLAFLPFYGEGASLADSLIEDYYGETKDTYSYFSVYESKKIVNTNSDIKNIIAKIVSKNYEPNELKNNPNIKDLITVAELSELKSAFGQSNLLMVPVNYFAGLNMGRAFGLTVFRLYDLNSGDLIYQRQNNLNTTYINEDSITMIAIITVGGTRSDFDTYFINK